jgi:hypothetical protein
MTFHVEECPNVQMLYVKIKVNFAFHSFCLMPKTFAMDYEIIQYKTFFLCEGVLKNLYNALVILHKTILFLCDLL